MMFHVKIMKNQMPVLIGQIRGDFKVTAKLELWASVEHILHYGTYVTPFIQYASLIFQ